MDPKKAIPPSKAAAKGSPGSALVQRRASAAAELVRRRSQFGSLASADLEVGSEAPADAPPVESAVVPAVVAVSSSAAAASVASSPPKPNGPTPQEQQPELRTPLTIPRTLPVSGSGSGDRPERRSSLAVSQSDLEAKVLAQGKQIVTLTEGKTQLYKEIRELNVALEAKTKAFGELKKELDSLRDSKAPTPAPAEPRSSASVPSVGVADAGLQPTSPGQGGSPNTEAVVGQPPGSRVPALLLTFAVGCAVGCAAGFSASQRRR